MKVNDTDTRTTPTWKQYRPLVHSSLVLNQEGPSPGTEPGEWLVLETSGFKLKTIFREPVA